MPDMLSNFVQFLTRRFDLPIGMNLERISLEAGENMHMDMKHILKSGFSVSKKEIDALTLKT